MLAEINFLILCQRICRDIDKVDQIFCISVNVIFDKCYILANWMLELSLEISFEHLIQECALSFDWTSNLEGYNIYTFCTNPIMRLTQILNFSIQFFSF